MIFNKTVTVETVKRDRYGRELGKVLAGDKDINLEQVRAGMVWHYKNYERTQSGTDRQAYAAAENEAKAALNVGYGMMMHQCHRGSGDIRNNRPDKVSPLDKY